MPQRWQVKSSGHALLCFGNLVVCGSRESGTVRMSSDQRVPVQMKNDFSGTSIDKATLGPTT